METKKTNNYLLKALKTELDILLPQVEAGNSVAHVKWAMAIALHKYLSAGHMLTDLDWFKKTTLYTGNKKILKKIA
ncbi:MAG: hypothetical protein K0U19_01670 [Proteobacteria bacterium]|nr:hypothetical protein [Pseudomonadota bacterium]